MTRVSEGTVLITGGTGGIGALLARHLLTEHGVAHLLLASRRGPLAPGAQELELELRATGADVRIAACDLSDRDQVEALLRSVPAEHPLTGIVHAAGTVEDSLIASMTTGQIDRVLAAKLDAGLHLHELTRELELGMFVMCSSIVATFGGAGQGNYAAANVFLDALAEHRRARDLAAISLGWGLWEGVGLSASLAGSPEHLLRRLSGSRSLRALSRTQGLELFDSALSTEPATVMPTPYDIGVVREEVAAGTAPRLMTSLVRTRPRQASAVGDRSLSARLSGASGEDRRAIIFEQIRAEIAVALGYEAADGLEMDLPFVELGGDSLVALELTNRLHAITGLNLPSTLMFDHRTPTALVDHLQARLTETANGGGPEASSEATDGRSGGDALTPLFRRAHNLGKITDGLTLVDTASRLRPTFAISHAEDQAPTVVPLAKGDQDPVVFCSRP